MKLGILGGSGQVGTALRSLHAHHSAPNSTTVDLTDRTALAGWLDTEQPDAVVNTAAMTNVPGAEDNPGLADAINADGARHVAELCAERDLPSVLISTDFVFDGSRRTPYPEDAATGPLGAYARSKLAGEQAALEAGSRNAALRAGWIFSSQGPNFITAILNRARQGEPLSVVADQHGAPCSAAAVARYALAIAEHLRAGPAEMSVFHLESHPPTTWHGFATVICERAHALGLLGEVPDITAISAAEYGGDSVERPAYTVLDGTATRSALGISPGDWARDLDVVLPDLVPHLR